MACDECRELSSHEFRSAEDLIHAVRLAAEEVNRGVLCRVPEEALGDAAQEALDSSLSSGALPDALSYGFQCTVCGDRFRLSADTRSGSGTWTREGERERAG